MAFLNLLEKLSNTHGVSGYEGPVRKLIMKELKPYVDEIEVDPMGNIIAFQTGSKYTPVMLSAHMDEIGLMAKEIDSSGKIYFSPIGGINEDTLVAQRVEILSISGIVKGVITYKELDQSEELAKPGKLPKFSDMYVDTGLDKKQLAKLGIKPGIYMVPEQPFTTMGNGSYVTGKGLDNRVGCAVLLELAKLLRSSDRKIHYVFTVQEEMGMYGSRTSLYKINPTWAVVIDATNAEDYDGQRGLGSGVNITAKDEEFIANKCLVDTLEGIAKKKKIPYMIEVSDLGTTDAHTISLAKGGLPTVVLSIPLRNLHSPVSIAKVSDMEAVVRLVKEVMKLPPEICVE